MHPRLYVGQVAKLDFEIVPIVLILAIRCALQLGALTVSSNDKASSATWEIKQEGL